MVSLFKSVSTRSFILSQAEDYLTTANDIILDHINKEFDLANSIVSILDYNCMRRIIT